MLADAFREKQARGNHVLAQFKLTSGRFRDEAMGGICRDWYRFRTYQKYHSRAVRCVNSVRVIAVVGSRKSHIAESAGLRKLRASCSAKSYRDVAHPTLCVAKLSNELKDGLA
jgi:hypothetical protein